MFPNNSPKISILRLAKVMKRETKIDQTYFLSETKTSTPMKSNHLKERIVFLPHPLSGILGSVLSQNLIHMTLQMFAVKIRQGFFWLNPIQTWSSSCRAEATASYLEMMEKTDVFRYLNPKFRPLNHQKTDLRVESRHFLEGLGRCCWVPHKDPQKGKGNPKIHWSWSYSWEE